MKRWLALILVLSLLIPFYTIARNSWETMQFYQRKIMTIRELRGEGDELGWKRAWEYAEIIVRSAKVYSLDPDLVFAVAWVESDFKNIMSDKDQYEPSVGIMKLKPSTYHYVTSHRLTPKQLLWDYKGNIKAGSEYLRRMYNKYNGWKLALAGYNAGPGRVDYFLEQTENRTFEELQRIDDFPSITKEYVPEVLKRQRQLKREYRKYMKNK